MARISEGPMNQEQRGPMRMSYKGFKDQKRPQNYVPLWPRKANSTFK